MRGGVSAKPVLIYALADPATGAVRYIGKTEKAAERRLAAHVAAARRPGAKRRSVAWVASVLSAGGEPVLLPLLTVLPGEDWAVAERDWIAAYRQAGAELTNLSDGGEGPAGYRWTSEQLAAKRVLRGPAHPKFGKPMHPAALAALSKARAALHADADWTRWCIQRRMAGFTPETRARSVAALKGAMADPAVRAKRLASLNAATAKPEYKRLVASQSNARWASDRDRIIAAQNAGKGERWRERQREAKRAQWADPDQRRKFLATQAAARLRTPDAAADAEKRRKLREATRATWADPVKRERMLAARKAKRGIGKTEPAVPA